MVSQGLWAYESCPETAVRALTCPSSCSCSGQFLWSAEKGRVVVVFCLVWRRQCVSSDTFSFFGRTFLQILSWTFINHIKINQILWTGSFTYGWVTVYIFAEFGVNEGCFSVPLHWLKWCGCVWIFLTSSCHLKAKFLLQIFCFDQVILSSEVTSFIF